MPSLVLDKRRRSETCSAPGCVEAPGAGDAFEVVFAAVGEVEACACGEVFDGLAHEHFGGTGEGADAGADGDGDAGDVVAVVFDFADVDAGADFDVELVDTCGDFLCAANGAGGPVEGGEESVAHGLDLVATKAGEFASHDRVVPLSDVLPYAVAELCGLCRGVDDVGKHDCGKVAVEAGVVSGD